MKEPLNTERLFHLVRPAAYIPIMSLSAVPRARMDMPSTTSEFQAPSSLVDPGFYPTPQHSANLSRELAGEWTCLT